MKKLLVVLGLGAMSAMAADVTGYIVDKNCSTNKAMLGNEACAKRCLGRDGAVAMLATDDGKIYTITNLDKVKDAAGKKVTVTGKIDEDKITVESVKM